LRHEPAEVAGIREYFQQVGMKIGNNVFTGLDQVNPADLHKPDHLLNIYLSLFKYIMEWVEWFLKKHKLQQGFDNAWKAIPPYLGFIVPKKAYREVTQWEGMSRHIRCRLKTATRGQTRTKLPDRSCCNMAASML